MEDGRCRLGPGGRLALVCLVERGSTLRAAAAALNVAPATAHRWWHRWLEATEQERRSRSCLRARAPVPRSCPWRLSAAAEMADQGAGPMQAVMTDNAMVCRRSRDFSAALRQLGARHILTPPRTPRWNGKAERFIRTLDEEWAHGRIWPSSTRRNRALASFLRYYNRRRPHTSLGDRPP